MEIITGHHQKVKFEAMNDFEMHVFNQALKVG
jgi:hypothetical protein